LVLAVVVMMNAFSQAVDQTITIQKRKFHQNRQIKTFPEVKSLLGNNPASAQEFKKYKTNNHVGSPLIIAGSTVMLIGAAVNLSSSIKEADDVNKGELKGDYPKGWD
jgi:hypothetical protein